MVYLKRIWFMTDQAKLTAEERVKRLADLKRINRECTNCDPGSICIPCTINAIRQAEDAVREEMSKPPTAGCCGGEVILHPARIHHKEGCPIKTQAIRENK